MESTLSNEFVYRELEETDYEGYIELHREFTPLNKSIRTADELSTKLPVTDLNTAPLLGADSNLHLYKKYDYVVTRENFSIYLNKMYVEDLAKIVVLYSPTKKRILGAGTVFILHLCTFKTPIFEDIPTHKIVNQL